MKIQQSLVTYAGFLLLTVIALLIIKTLNISYPIDITTKSSSGEFSVVGEGKVEAIPDTATVEAGIVANGVIVDEVKRKINEVNNKIIDELSKLGIDKKDIKTSNYSINPNYNYDGGANIITGYSGNASVSIKVRDTEKLPSVIEKATEAGANQVYGSNFSIDEPEKYREQARNKAIENAKQQAEKLAQQLGIRLGRVVNVVESSPSSPPTFFDKAVSLEARGAGAAPPDIQVGTQTITSTVTLYFEKR
jgi:uncharacterized protein YggE